MAMTNAQRQTNYRQRKLKDENGTGSRIDLVIDHSASLALKRLALHRGVTVTTLLSRLAVEEQQRVLANMSANEQSRYYDSVTG